MAKLGEWVRVDSKADRPLFDQLRTQIIGGIRDGRLAPGTRLPTVRELAGQLSLAVNTVARAYRELEAANILETRGRFGTFVARIDPADTAMASAARTFVGAAKALGITRAEAMSYIEAAFDRPDDAGVADGVDVVDGADAVSRTPAASTPAAPDRTPGIAGSPTSAH